MARSKQRQRTKNLTRGQWAALVSTLVVGVVLSCVGVVSGSLGQKNPVGAATQLATERLAVASVSPLRSDSSSWYCNWYLPGNGGLSKVDILLANTSSKALSATLKSYSAEPVQSRVMTVPPHSFLRYPETVSPNDQSGAVSFVANGGGTVAEMEMSGPTGSAVAPCNSSPSAHWVALGSNTLTGSESGISIFNPFGQDAVVDVALSSTSEQFSPGSLQGMVISPHSSTVINLMPYFSGRSHVVVSVSTRIGRVVLGGVVARNDKGNVGLSAMATFPATASQWSFPVGQLSTNQNQEILVYNPNSYQVTVNVKFSYLSLEKVSTSPTTSTTESATSTLASSGTVSNQTSAKVQQGIDKNLSRKVAGNSVAVISIKAQTAIVDGQSYKSDLTVEHGFGVVAADEFIGSESSPNVRYQVVGGTPLTTQHWIALYDPSLFGISNAQAWLATGGTGNSDPESQMTPLVDLGPTYFATPGQSPASLPTTQALLAQSTNKVLKKPKRLNSVGVLSPAVTGLIVSSNSPFVLGSVMGQNPGELYVVPVLPFAN